MFSKVFAAAALAVVSAADVPVFSSNDDYDEINLNIRMLSGNTTVTVASTHEFPVNMSMAVTMATDPATTTAFTDGTKDAIKTGANANTITATFTSSTRRRLSEDRRLTTAYTVAVAASLGFTSASAATAAKTTVQGASFLTSVANGVNTAMNGVAGYTPISAAAITGVSAGNVVDCATQTCNSNTAAAGAAAASPSPSPSSNAAKVAVSTLAAFAAFMASMF
jgi:hypothetical protein